MATQDDPMRGGTEGAQQKASEPRLANTSEKPGDMSAIPGVEAPIAHPAQEVAQEDLSAHPATADGGTDRARIVPPDNQGDSTPVTERIGGEAGDTVY